MPTHLKFTESIESFGHRYQYDVAYMHKLLNASPAGYAHFDAALPMASYRSALPAGAYYIARIEAMRFQDCGPCLQLAIDQAVEEGVCPCVLATAWGQGDLADPALEDVRAFARSVAANQPVDPALADRIQGHFGETGVAELGLCIASSGIFPTLKRALGEAKSCSAIRIKIPS